MSASRKMYLSRRDRPFTTSFGKNCQSISWRVWCPIDIALWAIVFLSLALLFWQLYYPYRKTTEQQDSDEQSQVSQNAVPQHDGILIKNNDNQYPYYGFSDPHRIVSTREGSVTSQDTSFLSTPAPMQLVDIPKFPSSGQLTGLGISFGSTSTLDLRFAHMQGISRQGNSYYIPSSIIMADSTKVATPPPAYVRDTHTHTYI